MCNQNRWNVYAVNKTKNVGTYYGLQVICRQFGSAPSSKPTINKIDFSVIFNNAVITLQSIVFPKDL